MDRFKRDILLKKHANGERDYTKRETRLWKGNYSPNGFVYLTIKYHNGKAEYTNYALVPTGGTDEQKETIYTTLWEQLVKKYPALKTV